MSDYPEYHTKKGKGAGITKIEGTGRKAGGEGTEKTMVAAFNPIQTGGGAFRTPPPEKS